MTPRYLPSACGNNLCIVQADRVIVVSMEDGRSLAASQRRLAETLGGPMARAYRDHADELEAALPKAPDLSGPVSHLQSVIEELVHD